MEYESYNFENGVPQLQTNTAIKFNIEDIISYKPYAPISSPSSISTSSAGTENTDDSDLDVVSLSPTKANSEAGALDVAPEQKDDKENTHARPMYSYNALIIKAIRDSAEQRITLKGIYDYIITSFPYYRKNRGTWQSAIRHNLSVGENFVKSPRSFNDRGKGNYWKLDETQGEVLVEESTGNVSRRKSPLLRKPDVPVPVHIPLYVPNATPSGLEFSASSQNWLPTQYHSPRPAIYSRYNPYAPPMVPISHKMRSLPALFPPSVVYGLEQLYGNPSSTLHGTASASVEHYKRAKYELHQQYFQRRHHPNQ